MICPTCGFSLGDEDEVCPVCGTRIEVNPQGDNSEEQENLVNTGNQSDYPVTKKNKSDQKNKKGEKLKANIPDTKRSNTTEEEGTDSRQPSFNHEKKGKKKRGRVVGIIILVCVIVVVCLFIAYFLIGGDSTNRSGADTTPVTEVDQLTEEEYVEEAKEPGSETALSSEQSGVTNVVPISSYIGYWNISGNEDEELTISNVTDSTVEFSLFSRGIYNLEDAVAHIDENNFASFACVDGKLMMTGNLIFYDDYIVVDIDRADMDYIDTGTMVFDERHLSSWHGDDNENVNSQSTTSQNTANSNEAEPYYESGNISTYYDSYYILPDSSTRLLDYNDIRYLTKDELRLARNEIYARHGRKFDDPTLQAYFNSQPWYVGTIEPEDFTQSMLSSIERSNIAFIESYE